ncbi:sialate O-acetylesterase-like [Haliotis cracherodii]|uniref:sialate O-acetylesterase-like n=1 Tax=Haliotis cracherodii TaxID=6455 RepID=UPI0039ECE94C
MGHLVMFNLLAVTFIWLVSFEVEAATFGFSKSYANHMVLQQAPKKSTIWGFASNVGETVTVHISGKGSVTTTTRHGDNGDVVWYAQLPPISAGGPYTITVTSREGKLTLSDVLFGDVWVCSGQSNMGFTMSMSGSFAYRDNHLNLYDMFARANSVGGKDWVHFSALCWLYGKHLYNTLKYPIGLISTADGGTMDEAWSSPDALAKCLSKHEIPAPKYKNGAVDHDTFSSLWNAMVHPLLHTTIYGVIWYQGESNSDPKNGLDRYKCTFPALIDDWRKQFSDASGGQTSNMFPFGFVQLAPFRHWNVNSGWGILRWHQTADYGYVPNDRMKNTFMAVAMDLPDYKSPHGSIHPRDKADIAERLYIEAMIVAYKRTDMLNRRGPFPTGFTEVVDRKTVQFSYANTKTTIEKRNNNGFEVCCVPRKDISDTRNFCPMTYPSKLWNAVPITHSDSTSVTIDYHSACSSSNPYLGGIRYEWKESPCDVKKCAVYNRLSGSPAPPFIHFVTL